MAFKPFKKKLPPDSADEDAIDGGSDDAQEAPAKLPAGKKKQQIAALKKLMK